MTGLLVQAGAGNRDALDQAFPFVYAQLRRLARRQLLHERMGHTLGVSGLVNEAYLKLIDQSRIDWRGREHFFAVAARAMRQILIDYARRRKAEKRGAGYEHTEIGDKQLGTETSLEQLLALDELLNRMDQIEPRLRLIVEYRYFCGLTEEETAKLLNVSVRTVQRDWIRARAWLYQELYPDQH